MNEKSLLKTIETEEDYYSALDRLEEIFDAEPNTKEGNELEILSILIEKYENKYFYIGYPEFGEEFDKEADNYRQKAEKKNI